MSTLSCSTAPMPFVTGGGPVYYPQAAPVVQTVQAPLPSPYVQTVPSVQSPIPAQPDISGGGSVMSPMQVPVAYQQPMYAPQQSVVPQQAFIPQQQFVPQQQFIQQPVYTQQPMYVPQQPVPTYAQQPIAQPQYVAPAPAQAMTGQNVLGGGGGAVDQTGMMAGLQQAVASLTQMVMGLQTQMAQRSQMNGGGGAASGGGAAGDCCGGATGGGPSPAKVTGGGATSAPAARSTDGVELPPIPTALMPRPSTTSTAPTPTPAPPRAPRTNTTELPPVPSTNGPAPTQSGLIGGAPLKVKGKEISKEQRENLQAVLEVGKEMGADRKTMVAAVATVIQESVAQNLDYGDRDSLGLFQQRPSQGWGTPEQVRDPKYAARKFFDQAIPANGKNPSMAITQLAQTVQRSGLPDAYAQWEGEANAIVDAFGA